MKVFAERLRSLRSDRGLSQRNVASVLNISQASYQCYENGSKMPVANKLPTLATLFNVSLDYLFGRIDEPRLPDKETLKIARELQAYRSGKQTDTNHSDLENS